MTEHRTQAFTLPELLVVVAITGILAALLVPAVRHAHEEGLSAACRSNLRELGRLAIAYADAHNGHFPWGRRSLSGYRENCWDFRIPSGGGPAEPGELWEGVRAPRVQQCPSFLGGPSNAQGDPYTGYNYNCSYVGKVEGDSGKRTVPTRLSAIRRPGETALFGDGEFAGGANKFMRAPVRDKAFDGSGSSVRDAGTQGFRHRGRTNVVFCDGHVESFSKPYTRSGAGNTAPGCGFLSPDNSLYGGE